MSEPKNELMRSASKNQLSDTPIPPMPISYPAKLAWVLLICAALGFIVLSLVIGLNPEYPYLKVLSVLRHGFEGALVGCICDIIAVKNVYSKARENFEPVVENVSRTVVLDMIRIRGLIERVQRLDDLQSEENQQWFQLQLQELMPSKESIAEKIDVFWTQSLWEESANWLANIDFHPILTASSDQSMRLLEVPELRDTLATLMETATEDRELTSEMLKRVQALGSSFTLSDLGVPAEEEKLEQLLVDIWEHWKRHQPDRSGNLKDSAQDWLIQKGLTRIAVSCAPVVSQTTIVDVLKPILNEARVTETMHDLAKRIRVNPASESDDRSQEPNLYDSLVLYLGALADAWSTLPQKERQQTMLALLDAWKPVVLSLLVDVLWWLRIKLMQPEDILAMPKFQHMLTHLSTQLEARSESIEERAVDSLQERLKALGKDGFVAMLQRNTQTQLDWIKVNGTLFGFLMGLCAGALAGLIEYSVH